MINQYRKLLSYLFVFFILFSDFEYTFAQTTYNDGPMELQVRVRNFDVTYNATDEALLGIGFAPDNLRFKIWARDEGNLSGLGWQGGDCLQSDYEPPGITPPTNAPTFNYVMYNHTFTGTTVPAAFDLRLEAWEDDLPTDAIGGFCNVGTTCTFEGPECCGVEVFGACIGIFTGDDNPCFADPWILGVDYRQGPPCAWYNHGYLAGTGCTNPLTGNATNDGWYLAEIESFWSYTDGDDCNSPIELGELVQGSQLSHFNSNACYTNTFGVPGNDVVYSFNVTEAKGVSITACGGSGSFERHLYLVSESCNTVLAVDSGTCPVINYPLCVPGDYKIILSGSDASQNGTFTLIANVDPSLTFDVELQKQNISCTDANDGALTAIVSGGTPPYVEYEWSSIGASTDSIIDGLSEGTYTVTVTDSEGCQTTATAEITNPAPLVIDSILPTDVSCGGATDGEAEVFAQGGTGSYSYLWSTAPIQQVTNPAIFLSSGNYMVTVTDQNGCEVTESVEIGTASPIEFVINDFQDVSCFGANDATISVSAIGGIEPYVFSWSEGTEGNTISGIGPGQVSVVLEDGDGCIEEETFFVNEPPLLESNLLSVVDLSCAGSDDGVAGVIGFGGTPPYSYNWAPGGNNQELLTQASAGDYVITITDANDCVTTDSVTITEPEPIQTELTGTDPDCDAEDKDNASLSLSASGGTGDLDVLWSDGSRNFDLFGVPGGKYIVFVTDENDCFAIDSIQLSVCDPLQDTVQIPGGDLHFVRAPNAFAPDGSGQNTHFNIIAKNALTVEVSVYNRWGEEVYYNRNILNSSNGWDGTFRGSNAPMGSYVYHLRVEYENGIYREKTGNVLLVR